jgi:hypothetical protein
VKFRQRLYSFRQKDRDSSTKLYSEDHPAFGKSAFDRLMVLTRIIPGELSAEYHLHVVPATLERAGIAEVIDIASGEKITIDEEEPKP